MSAQIAYNDFDNKDRYSIFIWWLNKYKLHIPRDIDFSTFKNKFCKLSQWKKVLWHLEHYDEITNRQCVDIYGILHAPSVIRDVREFLKEENKGRYVESVEDTGFDRWGNKCEFVHYTLKKSMDDNGQIKLFA